MNTNPESTDPLRVTLAGPSGESWIAVGGGPTLDDALEFAVESAPADTRWSVVAWSPLFGD